MALDGPDAEKASDRSLYSKCGIREAGELGLTFEARLGMLVSDHHLLQISISVDRGNRTAAQLVSVIG